jgi:hypothetical protein
MSSSRNPQNLPHSDGEPPFLYRGLCLPLGLAQRERFRAGASCRDSCQQQWRARAARVRLVQTIDARIDEQSDPPEVNGCERENPIAPIWPVKLKHIP